MTFWFTADQHFFHNNIINLVFRPFKSINQMHSNLINNYNELITDEDVVFFIGDFSIKGKEYKTQLEKIIEKLKGVKHLILGNHDKLNPFDYIEMGFRSVHTSLQGTFDSKIGLISIDMNHDPSVSYIDRNRLFLCGHVHNHYIQLKNVINVGVDVWDFKPVSLDQLVDTIDLRKYAL